MAIIMANRNQRKHVSVRALKECHASQETLLVVGRMFWQERKVQKAREWLHRALKVDNSNGDAWAFLYAFELECGNKDKADEVETRMITAEPSQGQYWTAVSKNVRNWKLKPKELQCEVMNQKPLPNSSFCFSSHNLLHLFAFQLVVKTLPKSLEEHTKSQKT